MGPLCHLPIDLPQLCHTSNCQPTFIYTQVKFVTIEYIINLPNMVCITALCGTWHILLTSKHYMLRKPALPVSK